MRRIPSQENCAVLEKKSLPSSNSLAVFTSAALPRCLCVGRGTCVLFATSDCRLLALLYHGTNSTDLVEGNRADWLMCFKRLVGLVVKIFVAFGCECVCPRVCLSACAAGAVAVATAIAHTRIHF